MTPPSLTNSIQQEITLLLSKWSSGDADALEQLIPMIYPELRRMAQRFMGRENSHHTLQTSALINEAYLRLVNQKAVEWKDRAHFFAVSAQVMRHILVDHARRYTYEKRGAGAKHLALEDVTIALQERAEEFVNLDCALHRLSEIDPRKSKVVELRFFGGLTVDETAEVLKISSITVKREWRSARAWLVREIGGNSS